MWGDKGKAHLGLRRLKQSDIEICRDGMAARSIVGIRICSAKSWRGHSCISCSVGGRHENPRSSGPCCRMMRRFSISRIPRSGRDSWRDPGCFLKPAGRFRPIARVTRCSSTRCKRFRRCSMGFNTLYDGDKRRWRFVLCGSSARKLRQTGTNLLPGHRADGAVGSPGGES